MFVNQILFCYENIAINFIRRFGMLECHLLHFNLKIDKSLMKLSNSGLQKPLKSSKFWTFLEVLTLAIFFVKFKCFHKKTTKSMFFSKQHQLKLNINLRKEKK